MVDKCSHEEIMQDIESLQQKILKELSYMIENDIEKTEWGASSMTIDNIFYFSKSLLAITGQHSEKLQELKESNRKRIQKKAAQEWEEMKAETVKNVDNNIIEGAKFMQEQILKQLRYMVENDTYAIKYIDKDDKEEKIITFEENLYCFDFIEKGLFCFNHLYYDMKRYRNELNDILRLKKEKMGAKNDK